MVVLLAVSCGCVNIALGIFLPEVRTQTFVCAFIWSRLIRFLHIDVRNSTGGRERVCYRRTVE